MHFGGVKARTFHPANFSRMNRAGVDLLSILTQTRESAVHQYKRMTWHKSDPSHQSVLHQY